MNEIKQVSRKLKVLLTALAIISIGALVATGVLVQKVRALQNPDIAAQNQVEQTVKDVGAVLVLPKNETPTLATVADPSKLSNQPFFQFAEAGDIVLIYSTSKKAILWRPSTKQVVEVSALNAAPSTSGQ
ncbi:MAG: hypothetical protein JWN50_302 [Parcubacteria group bacterium]|nr:hypothetical protein [Parcubacteria group bacterium]